MKINESKSTKKGCLMLNFKGIISNWNKVIEMVDPEDIYNDDKNDYGVDTNPHITILYGIDNTIPHKDVKDYVESRYDKPIECEVVSIGLFENEYDVLKFNIKGDDLHKMHEDIKNRFPHEETYPNYEPHMTIAYLKKGRGEKYVKNIKNMIIHSRTFEYSIGSDDTVKFKI